MNPFKGPEEYFVLKGGLVKRSIENRDSPTTPFRTNEGKNFDGDFLELKETSLEEKEWFFHRPTFAKSILLPQDLLDSPREVNPISFSKS